MEAVLAVIASCLVLLAGAQQNGDLRLVGGLNNNMGRVEIYLGFKWGTIDAGTSSSGQKGPAQTVCRQLGFKSSTNYGTVSDLNVDPASNDVPMAIQDVSCPYKVLAGNAHQHILRCDYEDGPPSPDHQYDFAVECTSSDSSVIPYDTQIRLVQGDTEFSSSGFVQVYLRGSWGPVCDMGEYDADSACRQLGYTEASDYDDSSIYNQGGTDKVSYFYCAESESCLRNCYNYGTTYAYCGLYYSYVNCTYTVSNQEVFGSGDESVCSLRSIVVMAVGIFIAVLVVILLMIITCVVVCCCCIPGCILHNTRRRVVYQTI